MRSITGTVKMRPLPAYLDVGFVHMPLATDNPPAPVEALQKLRQLAKRFANKQQMQSSTEGVYLLIQLRTRVLGCTLFPFPEVQARLRRHADLD